MKYFVLFVISLAALIIGGASAAQDLSHYNTPYGFRLPMLSGGEFVVTGYGNYNKSETDRTYYQGTSLNHYTKSFNSSLRGVVALSDKLLIQGELLFYPGQQISRFPGFPCDYEYVEQDAYLSPGFTMVFRPSPVLEVYGDVMFATADRKQYEECSPEAFLYDEVKYQRISFGFTYLGRF